MYLFICHIVIVQFSHILYKVHINQVHLEKIIKKEEPKKKEVNYENELFKESGEAIDEEETLFQYLLPANDGYYIGLENKGKSALRMKLALEGLYDPNNPNTDEISFRIGSRSKKSFFV